MNKLTCKNLGTETCDFEVTANTPDEAVAKMKEHARSVHAGKMGEMGQMMSEEQISDMMKTKLEQF